MPHKKPSDFEKISKVTQSASANFTSEVYKARKIPNGFNENVEKQKFKNIWYMKKEGDPQRANRELVAQEFFRLIIPSQPKTRLVTSGSRDNTFIISKEVEGFQPLATMAKSDFQKEILAGHLHNFGQILITSMVMKEKDLSEYNLGRDKHGNIIKIDGGACLTQSNNTAKNSGITSKDIDRLPYPNDYPINWLDLVKQGINKPTSELVTPDLSVNTLFRNDINIGILKILSLPDELIKKFVNSMVNDRIEARKIAEEIIAQKAQLETAALQNNSFKAFMRTPAAQTYFENYIKDLQSFKLPTKEFLLPKKMIEDALHDNRSNSYEILKGITEEEEDIEEATEEEEDTEEEGLGSDQIAVTFTINEEDEEGEDDFRELPSSFNRKADTHTSQENLMRDGFKQLQEKVTASGNATVNDKIGKKPTSMFFLPGNPIKANLMNLYKVSETRVNPDTALSNKR